MEIVAVGRDITERKKVEEEIITSERKYRLLFDNMLNGFAYHQIVVNDAGIPVDYRFIDVNEAFERQTGLVRDQVVGRRVTEALPGIEEDEFDWIGTYGKVALEGGGVTLEQYSEPLDRWYSVIAYAPQHGFFATIFDDITERKNAEAAILENERKYRELFETSIDTVFLSSLDGTLIDVNSAGEDLTGYTYDELIHLTVADLLQASDGPSRLEESMREAGSIRDMEMTLKRKDGSLVYCIITATYRHASDGSAVGYQGIIRDITERKRISEQLLQSQKMEAIGTLAGGIAHDFNNILATIMGYSSFLSVKVQGQEEVSEGLKAIEKSAFRASELTSQLLAYSRKGRMEIRPVSLNRVMEEVYTIVTKTFEKNIDIIFQPCEKNPVVEGDESQLNQVVMNLAVNAHNAMPRGGTLIMETCVKRVGMPPGGDDIDMEPGEYVCLCVSDTGIGMDEETRKRIFEPYFTTRKETGGTGLGLSVVYGIVKGHNGYVSVESEPGCGTTFKICFPRSDRTESSGIVEEDDVSGGTETILVIDDEEAILVMVKKVLIQSGYTVHTAHTGKEGIRLFEREFQSIDLVLLDIKMPGMAGDRVLERLIEIDPKARVLMSSGYSEEKLYENLMEKGAADFIGKPFRVSALMRKIREVLSTPRSA
jgi:PAS domain S-box-containing protein